MAEGFIFLHRQLSTHDLWLCEKFTRGQAWVDMLMLANHKPGVIRVRGLRIDVLRGQVGYSEVSLSARWRWSRDKVRRFMHELENDRMIAVARDNKTCIITILNYEQYQEVKAANNTADETAKRTTDRQQTRQQTDTNKNEKNKGISPSSESKDSSEGVYAPAGSLRSRGENPRVLGTNPRGVVYSPSFEEFWAIYPNKTGKGAAFKSWKAIEKKHPGVKPPHIIAALKAQIAADRFRGRDGELYIPLPTTWLNQARWDDEVAPPGGCMQGGRGIEEILARRAAQ